jgi:hypothetical protein
MSEWWTYTVADFLMFSSRTWYRLIEVYNAAFWPLHIATLLLGLAIVVLVARQPAWQGRAITGLLAVLWTWVAVAFLWRRFATISTAATWFAAAFIFQALLLAWAGPVRNCLTFSWRPGVRQAAGMVLLALALLGYPLISVVSGRGVAPAEVFGMMPDPTVLGTIGALLLAEGRWRRRLLAIPLLWCVVSGATLWALHA